MYYAKFLPEPGGPGGHVRHDTRIYLRDGHHFETTGTPVAAVIGKNPGAAGPGVPLGTWGPLSLDGDQLLPKVRKIFLEAYARAGKAKSVPDDAFVQVLNLSY